jgi:1-acyl-sn-glycerol-3-phosphate acyltransferase
VSEATFERPLAAPEAEAGSGVEAAGENVAETASNRDRVDRDAAGRARARGELSPAQRRFRHWVARSIAGLLIRALYRVEVEGAERFPRSPALFCFNHLGWPDPLLLLGTFPSQPRLHFYGPKQVTLSRGIRNRVMQWTNIPVPFSPSKDDLLTSVRRAQAVFDSGGSLAISAEGSIHIHEGDLLPFEQGAAYLALRAGVPIVPVAISGTSWARFRSRAIVRIGEPIPTGERPTRQAVARYTALSWHAVRALVDGDRDLPPPGRFGRWLTDLFNDWGPGGRAAASLVRGPDPADVPIPGAGDGS